MIQHQTHLRVRYAETDQMGYVYYGNYAAYFEVGRVEFVRHLGIPYKSLEEEHGVMMPVMELSIRYKRPALYDDLLTITSRMPELPEPRIHFEHEVHNEAGTLLVTGQVKLVFVQKASMRPCRPPAFFMQALQQAWQNC